MKNYITMRKSEIYDYVVNDVCEICEVSRDSLLSESRLQPLVDARILVVQYLRRLGFGFDEITLNIIRERVDTPDYKPPIIEIRKKSKNLRRQFCCYTLRCLDSKMFQRLSRELKQRLLAKYPDCKEDL